MEIRWIPGVLEYWDSVRGRTRRVIACIPPDRLEWTWRPGKFTLGDLVRHLATIERYMYAETVAGRPSAYPGCGRELADGYEAVLVYFDRLAAESRAIFAALPDDALSRKCLTPAGAAITTWKWLRAMVEHEAHHRGQIYLMLGMLDVPAPPLYGLTSEEVRARSSPIAAGDHQP
ncbi:MAG TPA: DinB family protein [Gemmatimonadales bacterium]|nr:DinB family protein [Gemmatimonadales bacterium]